MIHSVKLLRWKSHEKTEISFSRGTNVLVGPMGAGKTSVVDALSFALYGTFPSLKSKKVALEEIVMQRPERHTEGKVEVVIEVAGKKYILERSIAGRSAKAFLMEGGKIIDTGPTRVTEAVERLLKTDYELFARTIYADQNNIDSFLSLASGERKRQIDELLGLDKFEKARAGAGTAVNKLKAMKAEAERAMAGVDAGKLKLELEGAHKDERELSEKLEQTKKQTKELETQAVFKKEKLAKLSVKQNEYAALSNEKAGQKEALKSVEESSLRIAAQLKKRVEGKEIEAEAKRIASELSEQLELGKLVSLLSPKKERLSAEMETLGKRKQALEKQTSSRKIEEISSELLSTREKALQLKPLEASLSQKHSQIAASLAFAKKAGEEKALAQKSIQELEETFSAKNAEKQAAGNEAELAKTLEQKRLAASNRQARVLELEEAISKLAGKHTQCVVCDSPITHEKAEQLRGAKKSGLESANLELAKTIQESAEIAAKLEAARQLETQTAKLEEKIAECRKTLEKATAESAKIGELEKENEKVALEVAQNRQRVLELVKLESQLVSLLDAGRERDEIARKTEANAAELEKASKELSATQAKYSEEKRAALQEQAHELEKNRELVSLEIQARKAKEKLAEVEGKISKLGFEATELEAARNDLQETEKKLAGARVQCESGEKLLAEKDARAKELSQRVEGAQKQAARLSKLDSSIATVAKFQNAVSQAQGYLRSELVEAVNEAAGILWKSIYPYADYQSVKLNAGETDYSVEILANTGEWIPADHASGGEKTCASLSLRIAFATVLTPHLSLLVLDEPTHNLDANAITSFCRTLREELPKIVEQTFIITHDEALKEGANAAVYKIERDKDRGDKSTVEKLSAN